MKAVWEISEADVKRWGDFVKRHENKPLPMQRYRRNVRRLDIELSKRTVWHAIVGCQVTTQQRSGPGSNVERFLHSDSPALDLIGCRKATSLAKLLTSECTKAGLRRGNNISNYLVRIFDYLEGGGWHVLMAQLQTLCSHTTLKKERAVVAYILEERRFPGLGPKQARNFIQWLGLSRYEIPIDSRVLKCMRELGVNFVPNATALGDENVYLFVQGALQELAKRIEIYPCQLDACIFASFDIETDGAIS
jgi:thermostable 8-oxoguanine DNA glycosylase